MHRAIRSIARSQSNLRWCCGIWGNWRRRRRICSAQGAGLGRGELCGGPNPSIARRQSNLATVLSDLGELEEARDLLAQALASDERA